MQLSNFNVHDAFLGKPLKKYAYSQKTGKLNHLKVFGGLETKGRK